VPMPGQAQPQFHSRVEQIAPDGSSLSVLLDDARYPGPAPDGQHVAFVRSLPGGVGLFSHSLLDGTDSQLVAPGSFLALAYPRFAPDGRRLAFAAIGLVPAIGRPAPSNPLGWLFNTRTALAHGFPWEVWTVNADGTDLRQVPDVVDDDPSVAWSPNGNLLLVYGGWGSYLVDPASGTTTSLSYLAGYGSVGWLPD
ncbi:MAG TPA: hypothetical protein VGQ62_07255, partial [Chloroflexota bacterium]|nr:hypothetical protein [Chloroflexota bacterium]